MMSHMELCYSTPAVLDLDSPSVTTYWSSAKKKDKFISVSQSAPYANFISYQLKKKKGKK